MLKKSLFSLLAILLVFSVMSAEEVPIKDILYTIDGSEYFGKLVKVREGKVSFITQDGKRVFKRDSVRSVDLGKNRPGDKWKTKADITDTLLNRVLDQAPSTIDIRTNYPEAGYLVLYENETVKMREDSSSVKTRRVILKVLLERGKDEANQLYHYFKDNEHIKINFARTIDREGNVTPLNDNAIEDASIFTTLPEYQRLRSKKFSLKNVKLSSIIDFKITEITDKHDALHPFYEINTFQREEPVLHSSFQIEYPKSFDVSYEAFKMKKNKPQKSTRNGKKVLKWNVDSLDGYVDENHMPPNVLVTPSVVVTTDNGWDKISKRYHQKMMEAYKQNSKVEKKVNQLVKGSQNKVETIYNYLAENVNLKSIRYGSYYHYPRPLNEIFSSGKASYQDMAFLFWGMLKLAGLDPQFCLFPSKWSFNYKLHKSLPTLGAFDYCAVRVKVEGKKRYILPQEFQKYTFYDKKFYGVKGLQVKKDGGKIFQSSYLDPRVNSRVDVISGRLKNDGTLAIGHKLNLRGTAESQFRKLKTKSKEEIDNYFQNFVKDIDDKAELSDYTLEGYKDLTKDLNVVVRYRIPNFAFTAGEKYLAFNLPGIKYSAGGVGKSEREFPYFQPYFDFSKNRVRISLPDGYEVYYKPNDVNEKAPKIKYQANFKTGKGQFNFVDVFIEKNNWLERDKYPKYKNLIEKRAQMSKEKIILKKK